MGRFKTLEERAKLKMKKQAERKARAMKPVQGPLVIK